MWLNGIVRVWIQVLLKGIVVKGCMLIGTRSGAMGTGKGRLDTTMSTLLSHYPVPGTVTSPQGPITLGCQWGGKLDDVNFGTAYRMQAIGKTGVITGTKALLSTPFS